jgi:mRNA interferase MazF
VIEIHQGEVYWLEFGPCVVVQSDVFNRSHLATTVVCLITSNLTRAAAPGNVALKKGQANLPKASVVNVSQILTIDKTELSDRIGNLPAQTIDAILTGLQLLFDRA